MNNMKLLKYQNSFSDNRDAISLFSGGMGLDIGLINAGINIKIGQDFEPSCVATMIKNGHRGIGGDIRKIDPEDLLNLSDQKMGEPFLIAGGPPCQPFSTAGKRLGINDPRGSLFMDFIRMIDYIRPRFFVMENVKGLISAKLKPLSKEQLKIFQDDPEILAEGEPILDVILSEFSKLGYNTVFGILDAANYGVPQFRERFILIGSRDHENVFLPYPTHFQMHQDPNYRWRTLRDAIEDLENVESECATFSEERLNYLKMVPEGGNWRDLPESIVKKAMGGAYESGGGKVGFYRRLAYDQPSPTLVTSPVQKASMLCHPVLNRPLSVKEYARIQQFPDDWIFEGTIAAKYRQIGNAVPVGLGTEIGKAIMSVADNSAQIQTKRYRGTNIHNRIKDAISIGGSSFVD